MSSPKQLNPFGDVDLDSWKEKALGDLKGRTIESLAKTSEEGVTRKVLYTVADRPAGAAPMSGGAGRIAQVYREQEVEALHTRLSLDVELGARAAFFEGQDAATVKASLVEGLESAWLSGVEPGTELPDGVTGLLDPLRAWRELREVDWDAQAGALQQENYRLQIDQTWAFDQGLGPVEELAIFAAQGVALLRCFEDAGVRPELVAAQAFATFSVDTDFFMGLAKLRVARQLWAQVLGASGVEAGGRGLALHVRAGRRSWASRPDAMWGNLLRACTQGFASQLGGADWVALPAFDGGRSQEAARLATNMQVILREESFANEVEDPAAGSYYLENLSEQLREAAWRRFVSIEKSGGFEAYLQAREAEARGKEQLAARTKALAVGKRVLVGINRFVTDDAGPALDGATPQRAEFGISRLGEGFEALRERGASSGVEVQLLVTGELRHYKARADFARDWLAAGGLGLSEAKTELDAPQALLLCAADGAYGPLIELAKAARAAGCKWIGAVTRPGGREGDEAELEANIDAFVHMRADLPAVVGALLDQVGGAA